VEAFPCFALISAISRSKGIRKGNKLLQVHIYTTTESEKDNRKTGSKKENVSQRYTVHKQNSSGRAALEREVSIRFIFYHLFQRRFSGEPHPPSKGKKG
jgi:hypothetical protein